AHGITAADLLAFAERVGPDPERMEALAEQIAGIADSLASLRDSAVAAVDGDVADTATSGRNGVRASEFTGSPVEIGEGAQKRSLREQLDSMRATRRRPSP
ncbi:MAG: hypothetical protein OEM23_04140, partial [Gemmatimonadota bacterium]|nr:hypothetical protein [Gemmatimonadota bacterium]